MRLQLFVPLATALLLAACSGGAEEGSEENAPEDVVAKAAEDGLLPRPGRYSSTSEVLELDIPGMPKEQHAMARQMMVQGAAQDVSFCLKEGETQDKWLSHMAESNCTVSNYTAARGKVDVTMNCAGAGGISGKVSLTGTATDEGSDLIMSFSQLVPGMGEASIRMRVQSERVGDCAA